MLDEPVAQNVYAPPLVESPVDTSDDGHAHGRRAIAALVLSLLLVFVMLLSLAIFGWTAVGIVCFVVGWVVATVGFVTGVVSLVRIGRSTAPSGTGFTAGVFFAMLGNGGMVVFGGLLAFFANFGFSRGRQLRRFGRVLLPPIQAGNDWAQVPLVAGAEASLRTGLAAQWRENGRTEHASVAAFARLTLDLMALGAPPALIAAANRDALDEIRHAELCFSLARALDGKSESPGAFPEAQRARTLGGGRTLSLAGLAVDSLVDGALHEGVSARVIAKLARRCEEPQVRAVLKEIAADEGRHAAHGWDVVEWCLAEGGSTVAAALRGAVQALPRSMRSELPDGAADGGWERHGIHGHGLEAEEFASTRADLVRRVEKLLGGAAVAAAA